MVHLVPAGSGAGTYLDWGVVHVSLTNALIILLMLVIFAAALLLPFPGAAADTRDGSGPGGGPGGGTHAGDTATAGPESLGDDGTGARP